VKKLSILLLGLAIAWWQFPAAASESAVVTVLHVNDTHSHLEAEGPRTQALEGTVGGIARAAALIGQERAADPNALLLHAGDALQGDPSFNAFFGVPELEMLAGFGFDAFTVGNHELDFGPEIFGGMILPQAPNFAAVPMLGANIDNLVAVPSLDGRIKRSILKDVNGVKVGIFGLTVPGDLTSNPAPLVIREDIPEIAAAVVADLRAAGADVVLCLSHLGVLGDRALAQSVSGIDVIVGGHDHYLFEKPVIEKAPDGKKVLILQAGSYWQHVGRLRFTVVNGAFKLVDYRLLNVDDKVPEEPTVEAQVEALRPNQVAAWGDLFGTKLGTAVRPLGRTWDDKSFRRDTPLGNLITDAYRNVTNTDVALAALGLVAERIAEGPITGLDVFRAVSYGFDPDTGLGFRLMTCNITGANLLAALELGVSQVEYSDALFPQSSGLTFAYIRTRDPGKRVIPWTVFVNGRPLQAAKTYSLTVNEGIAFLLPAFGIELTNVQTVPNSFEYIVLRDEIVHLGSVRYYATGRILDLALPFDFDKDQLALSDLSR
jgi:2',3'-cyclic-nucleotide 2'-phosphodiesterase (5'-nucleotidase family)